MCWLIARHYLEICFFPGASVSIGARAAERGRAKEKTGGTGAPETGGRGAEETTKDGCREKG